MILQPRSGSVVSVQKSIFSFLCEEFYERIFVTFSYSILVAIVMEDIEVVAETIIHIDEVKEEPEVDHEETLIFFVKQEPVGHDGESVSNSIEKHEPDDHAVDQVWNFTEGDEQCSLKREVKQEDDEEELKPPMKVFLSSCEDSSEELERGHEDPLATCDEQFNGESACVFDDSSPIASTSMGNCSAPSTSRVIVQSSKSSVSEDSNDDDNSAIAGKSSKTFGIWTMEEFRLFVQPFDSAGADGVRGIAGPASLWRSGGGSDEERGTGARHTGLPVTVNAYVEANQRTACSNHSEYASHYPNINFARPGNDVDHDQSSSREQVRTKKIRENIHECSVCQMRFKFKSVLVGHLRLHSGERPYACCVCKKSFTKRCHLNEHMRNHNGERPYECSVCKKSFTQSYHLKGHMRIHNGERPYECSVCKRSFTKRFTLTEHMRIHNGERPYACSVCQKSFSRRSCLLEHMLTHSGERLHVCSVCQKSFKSKGVLVTHMRIHSGERPFECSVCKKSFSQRGHLLSHMPVHNAERPYECSACHKRFKSKGVLVTHMRIHSEERPYGCTVCQERFLCKSNLVQHMQLHCDERSHECSVCRKRFTSNCHLVRHMRVHRDHI